MSLSLNSKNSDNSPGMPKILLLEQRKKGLIDELKKFIMK